MFLVLVVFKYLADTIVDAVKSNTCRVDQQAGYPRKNQYCTLSPKAVCW